MVTKEIQSDVFWKAGILTLTVFLLGVFVGYWLDSNRVEEIREEYQKTYVNVNDATLQTLYYRTFQNYTNFCEPAIEENLKFADKVYEGGLRMDKYEKINKLAPSLILDKKKYVLLKLQFWLNCIELKRSCNASYKNLVYFYSHYNTTAEENAQGAVLMDLKEQCGKDLMLIPLPIDLDITTIEIVKNQYGIKRTPTILIDEKIKLEGAQTLGELKEYVDCR